MTLQKLFFYRTVISTINVKNEDSKKLNLKTFYIYTLDDKVSEINPKFRYQSKSGRRL